MKHCTFEQQLR